VTTVQSDSQRSIRWSINGLATALAVTVVASIAGYAAKAKCHFTGWPYPGEVPLNQFCYSDIPVLFEDRGMIAGAFPYAPEAWNRLLEYPVLTGVFMDLTARLSRTLNPTGDTESALQSYFNVNVVFLLGFALLTVYGVWLLLRERGARPSDALMVAAAPTLILAGTINWDLLVVAAAVFALLAWVRDQPVLAGLLIGIGTATKLYPIFFLGPLFVLCLRQGRMRAFGEVTLATVAAWTVANVPLAVAYPDGWLEFFRFNADRGADFGSIWYGLKLLGHPVPALNIIAPLSFVLLCAGIGALAWWAPRPPTIEQLAFLVVLAFLVTNKVYSPQYVLWMLPLAVLARGAVPFPRVLRHFALWQAAEVLYWAAVWAYLDGRIYDAYVFSIVIRVIVTLWFAAQVVRDIQTAPPLAPVAAATGEDGQVTGTYAGIGTSRQPLPSTE